MPEIVITCGDINGIGPEIALKAMNELNGMDLRFLFVAPSKVLTMYPNKIDFKIVDDFNSINENTNYLIDLGETDVKLGVPTSTSGKISYTAIFKALKYIEANYKNTAFVTAPISKYALHLAGFDMPGHTEILAEYFGTKDYAMIFLSDKWNAALATIHIPVAEIAESIKTIDFNSKVELLKKTLKNDLKIEKPSIALLGLNPHAGENGRIGGEENEILLPLVEKYPDLLKGPFVPDAFFANKLFEKFDLIYGMYHDQVLIPFKLMNGGAGVNFTAGLPVVRTSPDHGTAFDIAGKNCADASSMVNSINWAGKILENRLRLNEN